jgi:hypothetical protein
MQTASSYNELREMAIWTKPGQLGLSLASGKTVVYGVVMDWDVKNGTASIISFLSGDASIYFSSGGSIVGRGTHENVKIIAKQFVEEAQQMLGNATKTDQTPLPDENNVVFYLLTNKGIYSGQDNMDNLSKRNSIWLGLFLIGNEVINELRSVNEN